MSTHLVFLFVALVMQQLRSPAARYAEALTWLDKGDHNAAGAVVSGISVEHKLDGPQLEEQARMLGLIGLLKNVHSDGRDEMRLDSAEVQQLLTMRGDDYDRPAAWISNLLCFRYGSCRSPLTGGDDDGDPKSLHYTALPPNGNVTQPSLLIHPNPANSWVAFDYDLLAKPSNGFLVIRDITGREVQRLRLQEPKRQLIWDSREAAPGTYTVVLINGGQQIHAGKLIIRQ